MRRRRYLIAGVIVIAIAIAAVLFVSLRDKEKEGIIEASGQVRGTEITVSSRIPGRLREMLVREGQPVRAGDLIAKVSSDELEARFQQSLHRIHNARATIERTRSEVAQAKSVYELAKKDYERYQALFKKDIISRQQFEETESGYRVAAARLKSARDALEEASAARELAESSKAEAESQLKETSIYAPSDGTVISRLVEAGELVGPGSPVVVIVDLSDIYVRVFIKETDIGKIRLGNPARIYTDAFPDYFEGKVTEVSEKAQFTPREAHVKEERAKLVFGVKVGIENPKGFLKPGMPVDADIKWKEDASW